MYSKGKVFSIFIGLAIPLLWLTGCSLDVEDVAGPIETAEDRKLQKQLDKVRKKYAPVIGRYKGTFQMRRIKDGEETFLPIPFEMRLHVLPFHNGYKSDGTPIEIPRLIGHIDFHDALADEIEYVPFIVAYNAVSGKLSLNYEPKQESRLPSTVIQGQLLGTHYQGNYITPDGTVGTVEVKKYSNSVPSTSKDQRDEQKRIDFTNMYSQIAGDYINYAVDPRTGKKRCLLFRVFIAYGAEVKLRAQLHWGGTGVDFPLNVSFSPITEEIIMTPFQSFSQPGVPSQSAGIAAYGSFQDEWLELTHLTLIKGEQLSFRAKRHNKGRSIIKNPIAACKALK